MNEEDNKSPPSFWQVIAESLVDDQKNALRFARFGALVGGLLGVGLGIYLFDPFGFIGIGIFLIAGIVIGAFGSWLLYQLA